MENCRVIARLDIKGPNLVKGIHLEGLRVLGRPEEFAKHYYENGIDELFYQDVVASLYERNGLTDIITRTAKMAFIPLTVGGGIRNLEDIKQTLRAGADKVSINTAAIKNPEFISQASRKFGSSTIVIAIEAIKQQNGDYLCFVDNGREYTGVEVVTWAKHVQDLGAGEILLTSVDMEGTGLGFDLALAKMVSENLTIPVIMHGGAGKLEHFSDLLSNTNIDAVACASMLHYEYVSNRKIEANSSNEGNTYFLESGRSYSKVQGASINEIKLHLKKNAIKCRI